MEENSLAIIVQTGLVDPGIDLSTDLTEIAIDTIFTDGILKEIPIVKSIVAISKAGLAIKDMHFAKKILTFFQEFHKGNISQEKRDEFLNKLITDTPYRQDVMEQIIIYNDRFLITAKSKILANLLLAHVNGNIDWETFSETSQSLESINSRGLKAMSKLHGSGQMYQSFASQIEPMIDGFLLIAAGIAYLINGRTARLNKLGLCLLKYGIERDMEFHIENI
jgi:hypothetical protein